MRISGNEGSTYDIELFQLLLFQCSLYESNTFAYLISRTGYEDITGLSRSATDGYEMCPMEHHTE